jgi:hypothetical protein
MRIGVGNTDSMGDDGDRETPAGSKLVLEDDGGLGGVPKRPFWVHRSDEYVTRNDGNRRGGSFGDRGGRGRGGQWWRGKRGFGNGSYGSGGYAAATTAAVATEANFFFFVSVAFLYCIFQFLSI